MELVTRDGTVLNQVKLAPSTSIHPAGQHKDKKTQAEFTTFSGRPIKSRHPRFNPKYLPSDRGRGMSSGD